MADIFCQARFVLKPHKQLQGYLVEVLIILNTLF